MTLSNASLVYFRAENLPEGRFLEQDKVAVSPEDRGFQLGDGVYEVIRSYSGRLFHADEHLVRLRNSLAGVRIELGDVDKLGAIGLELIEKNGLTTGDALVYIQVTRGVQPRFAPQSQRPTLPTVYVGTARIEPDVRAQEQGVSVITVPDTRWARCDIKAIGLLPNVLARFAAQEQGADEAVFVRNGLVTEGTHTSVFGVSKGKVATHPADTRILAGITRAVVLDLCRQLELNVEQVPMRESELSTLDELFLACTTGEVIPVARLNHQPIGTGIPGELTRRLQVAFRSYVEARR